MAKGRSPTIKDVAKAAGVSSATVSYVLNDLNKVSPEVDALVRRVASEIGYSRNNAARALKTGRNNIIGCILPTLTSPVFPEIAKAVQLRAEKHGYATLVIDSGNEPMREERVVNTLARHGVDGAASELSSHHAGAISHGFFGCAVSRARQRARRPSRRRAADGRACHGAGA
jgi:LacI family transcriptional regulator